MKPLVPELSVSNLDKSLHFYRDVVGFEVLFARPENRFAYLSFYDSELMLEEDRPREGTSALWIIEPLDYPRGRGLNISIDCPNVDVLAARLAENAVRLRKPVDENWYRENQILHGERNLLVQDPDGYLLRFSQRLGTKPVSGQISPGSKT